MYIITVGVYVLLSNGYPGKIGEAEIYFQDQLQTSSTTVEQEKDITVSLSNDPRYDSGK